jgi:hypothetical protein
MAYDVLWTRFDFPAPMASLKPKRTQRSLVTLADSRCVVGEDSLYELRTSVGFSGLMRYF